VPWLKKFTESLNFGFTGRLMDKILLLLRSQWLNLLNICQLTPVSSVSENMSISSKSRTEARVPLRWWKWKKTHKLGIGPRDAIDSYAKLNTKLTEDDGYGEILEKIDTRDVKVIEFPGKKRDLTPIYGPIKESAFVQGELKRVGGQEPTIPVHLEDVDGKPYYCWARKEIVMELRHYLFQQVRLYGMATWIRDENAKWNLDEFEVQSFTSELTTDSPSSIFAELRAVPGNEWNKFADPLEELRGIRHGEDKVQ
jgi:hypothetical protein